MIIEGHFHSPPRFLVEVFSPLFRCFCSFPAQENIMREENQNPVFGPDLPPGWAPAGVRRRPPPKTPAASGDVLPASRSSSSSASSIDPPPLVEQESQSSAPSLLVNTSSASSSAPTASPLDASTLLRGGCPRQNLNNPEDTLAIARTILDRSGGLDPTAGGCPFMSVLTTR